MNSFTTQFGREIPFVPGFFDRNKYFLEADLNIFHQDLRVVSDGKLSLHYPAKDLVSYSAMVDFLDRHGLLNPRGNGIDLGGAEGTCIRLLKAAGWIGNATNLDILDMSRVADDAYFSKFVQIIRGIDANPTPGAAFLRQTLDEAKEGHGFHPGTPSTYGLELQFPHAMKLDQNFHMSALDAPGTYDFVMTVSCFDYFDLDVALPKVRSMLKPGGLFYAHMGYWWYPVNPSGIVGHFPYAAQRLTLEDLKRYYGAP